MQLVEITKVYISNKNKDGVEFKDKNGKPFWKIAIKTKQTGDDYYSCLAFKDTDEAMTLKEGDKKTVIFETNGSFKNFKFPAKTDILDAKINELHTRVTAVEKKVGIGSAHASIDTSKVQYPEEEINPDDIPF